MKVTERFFLLLMISALFTFALTAAGQTPAAKTVAENGEWTFAVSGDSRNCGDVVMPTIAQDLPATGSRFYWHLGDLRAIYDFDEDIKNRAGAAPLSIFAYENSAWQDFIENQANAFRVPFFLGIGNHEAILPKSRGEFITQFADWLNAPVLQEQRLRDNPNDHRLKTYYHWQQSGVDFIYLDNATTDQFDRGQLDWFAGVVNRAASNAAISTIVVGMHEALPDSLAFGHSMSDYPTGIASGREVYAKLLEAQTRGKKVYILASHSHFVMENIYNSEYWRTHGGVIPGWIVGTAGAFRYALPPNAEKLSPFARTNVYGYLAGTVKKDGTIAFNFRELKETDVPAAIKTKMGTDLVRWCFEKNSQVPSTAP